MALSINLTKLNMVVNWAVKKQQRTLLSFHNSYSEPMVKNVQVSMKLAWNLLENLILNFPFIALSFLCIITKIQLYFNLIKF